MSSYASVLASEKSCFPFIQGSPDLKAAQEVADYLGTRHHEFHFTVQVILSVLRLNCSMIKKTKD